MLDNFGRPTKPWYRRNWLKFVGLIIGLVFLMRIPVTRGIILWLLPLGYKADDIIVGVLLIILAVFLFVKGWISIPKIIKWFRDQ